MSVKLDAHGKCKREGGGPEARVCFLGRAVALCGTSVRRGKSSCDGGNSLHEPKRSAPCACGLSLLVSFRAAHPVSLSDARSSCFSLFFALR